MLGFLINDTDVQLTTTWNVTSNLNAWHHIALTRASNTFKLFVDGTQVGTATSTATMTRSYSDLFIGSSGHTWNATRATRGFIDGFRITRGTARYTSAFTAPSSAHLTSAGDVNKQIVVNSDADGVAIGTGGISQARIAKAWCNWDQTGTIAIRSSYNISSISDLGTGRTDVNFSTAMADTNYTALVYGNHSSSASAYTNFSEEQSYGLVLRTVNDIEVTHYKAGTGYIDSKQADLIIFGN